MALKFPLIPPPPASYVNVPVMMPVLRTFGNSKLILISWTWNWDVLVFSNYRKLFPPKHSKLIGVCPLFFVKFFYKFLITLS